RTTTPTPATRASNRSRSCPPAEAYSAAVLVREVRSEEFPAVAALTVRAYVVGGFTAPDSPYVDVLADVAGRAAAAEVYVAVDGRDGLLGAVAFAPPGSPYAQTTDPNDAEFRMLAVDPVARGRGVGEALVRRCVERATALG